MLKNAKKRKHADHLPMLEALVTLLMKKIKMHNHANSSMKHVKMILIKPSTMTFITIWITGHPTHKWILGHQKHIIMPSVSLS